MLFYIYLVPQCESCKCVRNGNFCGERGASYLYETRYSLGRNLNYTCGITGTLYYCAAPRATAQVKMNCGGDLCTQGETGMDYCALFK
jgi:hypothetical protein